MKIRTSTVGDAVQGPGRRKIWLVGEMVTRIDVEILGRHHMLVAGFCGQIVVDRGRHGATAGYRQRATVAEVVLHVDDNQRSHTIHPSPSNNPR